MNKIIKGRQPISTKTDNSDFANETLDFNPLKLDKELKAELDGQGLVGRFLNAKQMLENYGFHKSGWQVYKRTGVKQGAGAFKFGADPEGHVRFRDLILGVKPKEEQDQWSRQLAAKRKRQNGYNKSAAQELRNLAREHSADVNVLEGYESGGDDSDGDEE